MQLDLSTLDRRVTQTEMLLTMARECEFTEMVADIERDIRKAILPNLAILACMAAGDADMMALVAQYRRLKEMLG